MLSREITYTNYNGDSITETFYFNLTRSELTMWEASEEGGLSKKLEAIVGKKDGPKIMKTFHDLIMLAYGEKSPDGRRFIKSDELSKAFSETPAFDIIFTEIVMNPEKALEFVEKLIPEDMRSAANAAT